MKIVILVVLLILVAPTIAKRFAGEDEELRPAGGPLVRMVRRHGLRRLLLVVLAGIVALGVAAAYLFER